MQIKQWGNLEWCLSGELLTRSMWAEIDRVTVEWMNRPENKKAILDMAFPPPSPVLRFIASAND